jgi:hypothetical protein
VHCLNKKGTKKKRKHVKKGKKRKNKAKMAVKGVKYIIKVHEGQIFVYHGTEKNKLIHLGVMMSYRPNKDRCLDV